MTAAGNFLGGIFTGATSPETVDIKTVKVHTNHIISSIGEKYSATDISNMYLNTVLPLPKYIQIHILIIPNNIRQEYGIDNDYVDTKGFVYFEITKTIYGLAQFGRLAHDDLKQPHKHIHGLLYHKS